MLTHVFSPHSNIVMGHARTPSHALHGTHSPTLMLYSLANALMGPLGSKNRIACSDQHHVFDKKRLYDVRVHLLAKSFTSHMQANIK